MQPAARRDQRPGCSGLIGLGLLPVLQRRAAVLIKRVLACLIGVGIAGGDLCGDQIAFRLHRLAGGDRRQHLALGDMIAGAHIDIYDLAGEGREDLGGGVVVGGDLCFHGNQAGKFPRGHGAQRDVCPLRAVGAKAALDQLRQRRLRLGRKRVAQAPAPESARPRQRRRPLPGCAVGRCAAGLLWAAFPSRFPCMKHPDGWGYKRAGLQEPYRPERLGKPMRLLVVEDNDQLAELICRGLKAAGFDSDRAARIAEAEDAIQASRYGAMIVDLGLPDGDGRNLVTSLRAKGDATPVLMLTARGTTEERSPVCLSGADDYLVKPFAFEELVARLRALLRRPGEFLGDLVWSAGNLYLRQRRARLFVDGTPQSFSAASWRFWKSSSAGPAGWCPSGWSRIISSAFGRRPLQCGGSLCASAAQAAERYRRRCRGPYRARRRLHPDGAQAVTFRLSLQSRITCFHLLAIVIAAMLVPLANYLVINQFANQFEVRILETMPQPSAQYLSRDSRKDWRLGPAGRPADACMRHGLDGLSYAVADAATALFFPRIPGKARRCRRSPPSSFSAIRENGAEFYSLALKRGEGDDAIWIKVAQNIQHPDVIFDDIVSSYLGHIGWFTVTILALLLAIDIVVIRSALAAGAARIRNRQRHRSGQDESAPARSRRAAGAVAPDRFHEPGAGPAGTGHPGPARIHRRRGARTSHATRGAAHAGRDHARPAKGWTRSRPTFW